MRFYRIADSRHSPESGEGARLHGGRWNSPGRAVIYACETMTGAILAGHRRIPPYGMAGGKPGDVGRNWVERTDGTRTNLGYADETEVNANEIFVIETPGGGGYG